MIRKLIATLLMVIGIVGIAGGVWGIYTVETNDDFTMFLAMYGLADLAPQTESESDPVKQLTEGVLGLANDAIDSLDGVTSDLFGVKASDYLSEASDGLIDLADTRGLKFNVCMYRTEILLIGIIILQSGMLLWAWSRK